MMVMAGRRLAAVGLLAAAMAAAAALWAVPHQALAPSHAIRHASVAVDKATLGPVLAAASRVPTSRHALTGAITVVVSLLGLALVGYAGRQRPQPVRVVARPGRRGRSPPAAPMRHPVRTRD